MEIRRISIEKLLQIHELDHYFAVLGSRSVDYLDINSLEGEYRIVIQDFGSIEILLNRL